ncbi:NERD domain-containing protein [Streptomyces coelicolor]|nr:NERD domain-containing protein [Streptomyces coelicolor]
MSAWAGLNPEAARADAVAARWELGAEAERETARRLRVLRLYGWRIHHDLRLAGRRFNLDHVLVSACGTAVVVADTKRWPVGRSVTADGGRLWLVGKGVVEDRTGEAEKAARYAALVAAAVGVQVWPLLIVHGSDVRDGHLEVDTVSGRVQVVGVDQAVRVLRAAPAGWSWSRARQTVGRVDEVLRPYR